MDIPWAPKECAVCGEDATLDQHVIHTGLGVRVCETCPLDNVKGQDIRNARLYWVMGWKS